jgi:chromosome segregation ATPase
MKNFHQNLLIALALCLCGLCAFQWYNQTVQRKEVQSLNQLVYDQAAAIQRYTNSISNMDHQIAELEARIAELKETIKTNTQTMQAQKREISRLDIANTSLTNEVAQYKEDTDTLQKKLNEAFEMEKKLNASMQELVKQRDEFVQKYNDSVKERNGIVDKYNDLVTRVEKLQGGGKDSQK